MRRAAWDAVIGMAMAGLLWWAVRGMIAIGAERFGR